MARERKHQNPLLSPLPLPLQSRSHEIFSFPTTIFSCSQGTAKNVIKSTSVFCHAALTAGSLAFSMESSIVSSCYWTRIKSASACSFLCTNSVRLFARPEWRPSLTLLPVSSSYWAPCTEQLFRGGLPCSVLIFKALVEAWAFSGWTGKDLDWASEDLGSGTGVISSIIMHWQILLPFLSLSFSHVNVMDVPLKIVLGYAKVITVLLIFARFVWESSSMIISLYGFF